MSDPTTLIEYFSKTQKLPSEGRQFLAQLEKTIAQDLWSSAGGHWSEYSIDIFRERSMQELHERLQGESEQDFQKAWVDVVRDFHQNYWGEVRLKKKEKKPQAEDARIFWELFSYIWILLQATFITKTAIFYFGIKAAAQEDAGEGKVYVLLAILFSFLSLGWFAYRKSQKKSDK